MNHAHKHQCDCITGGTYPRLRQGGQYIKAALSPPLGLPLACVPSCLVYFALAGAHKSRSPRLDREVGGEPVESSSSSSSRHSLFPVMCWGSAAPHKAFSGAGLKMAALWRGQYSRWDECRPEVLSAVVQAWSEGNASVYLLYLFSISPLDLDFMDFISAWLHFAYGPKSR